MKAVHAFSLQHSAPSEPLRPGEDDSEIIKASDVDRAAYYSAIYYDDDNGLLWRLFWRLIWYNSVLLVACFAAFLIALSLRGPSQLALKASPPEEVIVQPSHAAAPSEPEGLGVPEGTFDPLFGTLADDHIRVAFFIPAREIVSPAASTVDQISVAGQARLAAVAALEAELTTALERASTAVGPSAVAVGRMPEGRLAAVVTLEAEPTTALETASTAVEPSAAVVAGMPEVQAAALSIPDAEPTKAPETAITAAQPSAAAVAGMPEVQAAAVATLDADPTTVLEIARTTVEPSAGDHGYLAVDSREAAAGPAEPALSTPRMPRPRPADAMILFARAAAPSEPAGLGVPKGSFDALFNTVAGDHSRVAFFIPAREIVSPVASMVGHFPAAGQGPEARLAAVATLDAEPTKALETASTSVEPSAADRGMPEVQAAAVATLDADPTTVLEIASTAVEPSTAAAAGMPQVQAAAISIPDAEPTKELETASTAVEPSAAAIPEMPEVQAAAVATLDADPTTVLEIARTAAQPSAAAVARIPEIQAAAISVPDAEPTKALETVSTAVEPSAGTHHVPEVQAAAIAMPGAEPTKALEIPSTAVEASAGADPDFPAVDSREAAAVPAEPALSTPRMPRPRPADAVIVFAPLDLPGPVERSEPEPPRPERTTAPQGQPASQAGTPVQAPPQASGSVLALPTALLPQASVSALALPPALLPLLPPRSTTSGSALN